MNIKRIIREEIDGFDWIKDNSISGEELRDLILRNNATSIPFEWVSDNLNLVGTPIKSLDNLQSVGGFLDLWGTPIQSLGNLQRVGGNLYLGGTPIQSLGNLQSVGDNLDLRGTKIQSLGKLESVGGYLHLGGTPLAKKHSEAVIRQMVQVEGNIYL